MNLLVRPALQSEGWPNKTKTRILLTRDAGFGTTKKLAETVGVEPTIQV